MTARLQPRSVARRQRIRLLALLVAVLPGAPNAAPNTYVTESLRSADFTCRAFLTSIRTGSDGATLVTFSGAEPWYVVDSDDVRSLLLMTQALGTNVCYQTEPAQGDPSRIKSAFIDPR